MHGRNMKVRELKLNPNKSEDEQCRLKYIEGIFTHATSYYNPDTLSLEKKKGYWNYMHGSMVGGMALCYMGLYIMGYEFIRYGV